VDRVVWGISKLLHRIIIIVVVKLSAQIIIRTSDRVQVLGYTPLHILFIYGSGIGLRLCETSVYKNPFTYTMEDTLVHVDNWRNNNSDANGNSIRISQSLVQFSQPNLRMDKPYPPLNETGQYMYDPRHNLMIKFLCACMFKSRQKKIGEDNSGKYAIERTIIVTVIRKVGLSVKTENLNSVQ
jgi:hypothetical protein